MSINFIDDFYYFKCPHCDIMHQVNKTGIRCIIFRHAVYKNSSFVNPILLKKNVKNG